MRIQSILVLLAVLSGAAGCGASSSEESTSAPSKPISQAPRALTQPEVLSVRLRTARAIVLARLGPPSATGPELIGGDRCLYWRIANQPPTALWRLCFKADRLHIVATYLT